MGEAQSLWDGDFGDVRAAIWDAHYGKGLSMGYAASAEESLRKIKAEQDALKAQLEVAVEALVGLSYVPDEITLEHLEKTCHDALAKIHAMQADAPPQPEEDTP